jgi:hypothetical protein
MKKLFDLFFKKYKYKKERFHIAGTNGYKEHLEFIGYLNHNNIEIINSWISYYEYSNNHRKPEYIHYVIKIKK